MNSGIDLWGESTGLYFLSAVFQGNLALLALIGVFVVFKIQQLNSRIDHTNDVMFRYMHDELSLRLPQQGKSVPLLYYTDENGVLDIDAILEDLQQKGSSTETVRLLKEDDKLKNQKKSCQSFSNQKPIIRKKMKLPIYLTLFVIIISLVCLPHIHKIHYWCLTSEIYIIWGVILFNVVSLYLNIRFIMQTVKDS